MPTGPAIWMYWETPPGTARAPYLDACEATIRMNAGMLPVVLLDDQTAEHFAGALPGCWDAMTPVQRSDWTRVRVVYRHGGLWVDADTIALKPLDDLFGRLSDSRSFLGYGADGVHNGLFSARAGSPLLGEWASLQDKLLDRTDPVDLHWTALGSSIVVPLAERFDWIRVDHRQIAPIDWQDSQILLSRTFPLRKVLAADPITVMLYNARMGQPLRSVSADRVMNGFTLVGRLLRHALGLGQRRIATTAEALHLAGSLSRRASARRAYRKRAGAPR